MALNLPVHGEANWDQKLVTALMNMQASLDSNTSTLASIQTTLTAIQASITSLTSSVGQAVWQA